MSLLSDAFDGFVDFVSNIGGNSNAPGTYAPGASSPGPYAPSYPSDSFPSAETIGKIAGPLLSFASPLINASVTRPKVPNLPKFPDVPSSVKNDPRVQKLLGSYGFTDGTMPTMSQPTAPSALQIAFPTMLNAATGLVNSLAKPDVAPKPQVVITQPAGSNTPQIAQAPQPTVISSDPANPLHALADSVLAKQATDAVATTTKYDPLFEKAAQEHGIDVNLLRSFAQQESNGDPNAVGYAANDKGQRAKGLMQLMPDAANDAAGRSVTDSELFNPATNIDLAAKHLATILKQVGVNDQGQAQYDKVFTAYYQGVAGSKNPDIYAKSKGYRDQMYRRLAANKQYYG